MTPQVDPSVLQCCNKVIGDTPQALEMAKLCIECKMPAEELRDTLQAQLDQAQAIKSKFFPGHS
jgi:hypothetical protein